MSRKADNLRAKFIIEYLIDLNATQAAIRAGYSTKTARSQAQRLLTRVDIQFEINTAMAARSKRTQITADYILNGIRDTIERCRQIQPVLDRNGDPVMIETEDGEMAAAFTFREIGALKGYELLGKHLRLFSDRLEVEITDKRELAKIMLEKKLLTQGISEAEAIEELVALGVDREDLQVNA